MAKRKIASIISYYIEKNGNVRAITDLKTQNKIINSTAKSQITVNQKIESDKLELINQKIL